MIGSRSESGTSLRLAVLPITFGFNFEGISKELSLPMSGFRAVSFFAGSGGSAGGVTFLMAVRALVVLVMAGAAG